MTDSAPGDEGRQVRLRAADGAGVVRIDSLRAADGAGVVRIGAHVAAATR